MKQTLYQCATCNMTEDGYCICESCINNCHEGHLTYQSFSESGFCDCGWEGSRGIRPCKFVLPSGLKVFEAMKKGIFPDQATFDLYNQLLLEYNICLKTLCDGVRTTKKKRGIQKLF